MKDEDSQPPVWVRQFGLFGVIIADVVSYTGMGLGAAYLAWKKLGAPQWVFAIGGMVGFVLSMLRLYQRSRKEIDEAKTDDRR